MFKTDLLGEMAEDYSYNYDDPSNRADCIANLQSDFAQSFPPSPKSKQEQDYAPPVFDFTIYRDRITVQLGANKNNMY